METWLQIRTIGTVETSEEGFRIQMNQQYISALTQLQGFSHLQILWWAHLTDNPRDRDTLIAEQLFKRGPDRLGIFATRAPTRPNPIMVSTIKVTGIDFESGIIDTPFIDADDGTPVLDIKPYFPMERVQDLTVPAWCQHWPKWQEETMAFDWQAEINPGSE